jgi:hypothetical protein
MKIRSLLPVAALVAVTPFLISAPASAAVTFDAGTGTGFVGKGDVQLALGLNNSQIQNASVSFTYSSTSVSSATWTCDKDSNDNTQERANTTTTTTQGVVSTVARVKNQITGYNLTGFGGGTSVETEREGPAVGSCPTGWTAIDLVEGDPVVTGGGLFVNGVPLQ